MDREPIVETQAWPLRAPLLFVLGALIGLAIHLLARGAESWQITENPLRLGAAAALAAGGIVFAVSLDRIRWLWSVFLAAGAGAVAGFVVGWNGSPDHWSAGEGWQLVAALLAIGIAVPIFQASRDAGRWNPDYRAVHAYAWTDAVLWAVACGFTLLTWLLLVLLAELFHLIGIDLLRDLLRQSWFGWVALCGALGAAIGLLRERDRILGLLQRVATATLSVLAPILAAGLVVFVLALPFTGLEPLWKQTSATTPILLACILGGVVLINAAIGRDSDEETDSRIVRWAAAALAAVTLPLSIVAAVSTGKRIAQHGFTPDRLWAAVFVAITVVGAAVYLLALIRGRAGWPALLRTMNLRLAIGIGLVALFLALPVVNFGAISTRDQLARLDSGRVSPDEFDWAAMRFDFGPAGRRALERLRASGRTAQVRAFAARYLGAKSRHDEGLIEAELAAHRPPPPPLRLRGSAGPVPEALRRALYETDVLNGGACAGPGECLLFWKPGDQVAVAVMDGCAASVVGRDRQARRDVDCKVELTAFEQGPEGWREATYAQVSRRPPGPEKPLGSPEDLAGLRAEREAIERGDVTVREVRYRQVFIGGRPAGVPFE